MILQCIIAISFLFFAGCSPSSQEEFLSEGEGVIKAFTQELKKIHNKEEAQKHYRPIKKKYQKIAGLMVSLKEINELEEEVSPINSRDGEELFQELSRLYEIPGVREILEKAQEEAFTSLNGEPDKS